MDSSDFVELLTSHQARLYGYILSLVFSPTDADDVLQETNRVLWQKSTSFQRGTNFVAWAFRIAFYQVQAHRRRLQREKLIFDDELLAAIAEEASARDEGFRERHRLLRCCLEELGVRQRDLVRRRYSVGTTIDNIAVQVGRSAAAVKQALFRCRKALIECIERRALQEG